MLSCLCNFSGCVGVVANVCAVIVSALAAYGAVKASRRDQKIDLVKDRVATIKLWTVVCESLKDAFEKAEKASFDYKSISITEFRTVFCEHIENSEIKTLFGGNKTSNDLLCLIAERIGLTECYFDNAKISSLVHEVEGLILDVVRADSSGGVILEPCIAPGDQRLERIKGSLCRDVENAIVIMKNETKLSV